MADLVGTEPGAHEVFDIDVLVAGITDANRHDAVDMGPAVGLEREGAVLGLQVLIDEGVRSGVSERDLGEVLAEARRRVG